VSPEPSRRTTLGCVRRAEIEHLLARDAVVLRRERPDLIDAIDWLLHRRELVAVLPGVYATDREPMTRMLAIARSRPDAVVVGAAAAAITFWPSIRFSVVEAAVPLRVTPRPGFRFECRSVPAELVWHIGRVRVSSPALTAIDLAATDGGEGIDHVLRTRSATLSQLRSALHAVPGRAGNRLRRHVLLDSRDEPWSQAERRLHRLLHSDRITGWRANHPVRLDDRTVYIDVAFPAVRLAIEVDGRLHEDRADVFERDRQRQNDLVLAGWTVLRFTWRMLVDDPAGVLTTIYRQRLLAVRAMRLA